MSQRVRGFMTIKPIFEIVVMFKRDLGKAPDSDGGSVCYDSSCPSRFICTIVVYVLC